MRESLGWCWNEDWGGEVHSGGKGDRGGNTGVGGWEGGEDVPEVGASPRGGGTPPCVLQISSYERLCYLFPPSSFPSSVAVLSPSFLRRSRAGGSGMVPA